MGNGINHDGSLDDIGKSSIYEEEILEELNNYPERFSPNVVLRPLYQEMILPNIFFIGGGAEVSYFLLMKKMFDYFQIHFPIILLRDSALIIDKNSSEKISKLGLKAEELFFETEKLIKKWTLNHSDNFQLEKEKSELKKVFDELNKTVIFSIISTNISFFLFLESVTCEMGFLIESPEVVFLLKIEGTDILF